MNLNPQFLDTPEYRRFKRKLGANAFECVWKMFSTCQTSKQTTLLIYDSEDLHEIAGEPATIEPFALMDLVIELGWITPTKDTKVYEATLFINENAPLIARWNNGRMGGRKKQTKELKEQIKEVTNKSVNQWDNQSVNGEGEPPQMNTHSNNSYEIDESTPF